MGKILIVDDEAFLRAFLVSMLEDEGYVVEAASNGREALENLRQSDPLPDVILLDLMMPVVNGWEFRKAQLADPTLARVPVILVSGAGSLRDSVAHLGAAGLLAKPFEPEDLLAAIAPFCSAGGRPGP